MAKYFPATMVARTGVKDLIAGKLLQVPCLSDAAASAVLMFGLNSQVLPLPFLPPLRRLCLDPVNRPKLRLRDLVVLSLVCLEVTPTAVVIEVTLSVKQ